MKYFDRFFQPFGWQENTFTAKDGAVLRYGQVAPIGGTTKGHIVITTGYSDHIENYFDTIDAYLDRGYAVWIMDWAGQGGSSKRGSSPAADKAFGVAEHVAHLHEFRQRIVGPAVTVPLPVIISTHSLGGQIALNYLQQHPADFNAAIMAAPLVDFGLSAQARAVLKGIFRYAVYAGWRDSALLGGRSGIQKQATNERRKLRKDEPVRIDLHRTFFNIARPLGAEDPTVGFVDSLFESTARMNEEIVLKNMQTPILLGMAAKDHIVNNDSIRRAAQFLPDARLVELAGATHGIWQDRPEVVTAWWTHIDSFLQDQHKRWTMMPKGDAVVPPPPKV